MGTPGGARARLALSFAVQRLRISVSSSVAFEHVFAAQLLHVSHNRVVRYRRDAFSPNDLQLFAFPLITPSTRTPRRFRIIPSRPRALSNPRFHCSPNSVVCNGGEERVSFSRPFIAIIRRSRLRGATRPIPWPSSAASRSTESSLFADYAPTEQPRAP